MSFNIKLQAYTGVEVSNGTSQHEGAQKKLTAIENGGNNETAAMIFSDAAFEPKISNHEFFLIQKEMETCFHVLKEEGSRKLDINDYLPEPVGIKGLKKLKGSIRKIGTKC